MASYRSEGSLTSSWRTSAAPIPYRAGPFEYQPAVLCNCGAKAARWISWSRDNPGRRYFKCSDARNGGCEFYKWFEGPTSSFIRDLLNDLRDAVWSLRMEKEQLEVAAADGLAKAAEANACRQEMVVLRKTVAEQETKMAVLEDMNRRLENERCVIFSGLLVVVCGVFLLMFGKK
ncbi:Os02g0508200 [Oryza sativa Japonica Group]|uniref:Os02g0508200 protein n=1 Tax=Oryza sativa subsp. japonica TaxID=39947 RepID=A0A0P0VJD8_ORYSJ|nr:uncharacterized protein LOC107276018 [Oryza sativa Japonica Group]BAS78843.1 Os02g0508200 [Oryza sativa Japonica Group]